VSKFFYAHKTFLSAKTKIELMQERKTLKKAQNNHSA